MSTHSSTPRKGTGKKRVAVCPKPGCNWRMPVDGDKYAVERARKAHYQSHHSD